MTAPAIRRPAPAAAARHGAVRSAPHDDGLDRLLADPRLGSTAKAVAVALCRNWAWGRKSTCWPSDRSVGAKVGRSVGQVQRGLRELERAGWVEREKTAEVPNGRRLRLLWRGATADGGAQPDCPEARTGGWSEVRSEAVVIVKPEIEPEGPEIPPRPRQEAAQPASAAQETALADPEPRQPPLAQLTTPAPPKDAENPPAVAQVPREPVEASRKPLPPPHAAPAPPLARPEVPGASRLPRRLGLGLAELVQVVGATADPILAAELARRTAPAPAPEPSPQTLATAALLEKLPGRHDLITAAAQRLCEDLSDHKSPSWSFFRKAAESVASRRAPAEALLDCLRQATGPQARDKGRVFVTAWKREGQGAG